LPLLLLPLLLPLLPPTTTTLRPPSFLAAALAALLSDCLVGRSGSDTDFFILCMRRKDRLLLCPPCADGRLPPPIGSPLLEVPLEVPQWLLPIKE